MKMNTLNWDLEYTKDIESGNGFDIWDTVGIDTKTKQRTEHGLFSPSYGGDEVESATDLYSCECGALKGKFYLGIECDECHTEVKYRNNDINKTGWMTIKDYTLINPLFFNILIKALGQKNLSNIIKYNKEIDQDGNIITNMDDYDENNPYCNLGMIEFEEKFDEVLNFFRPLKKDKAKYFDFIDQNRDKIFVHHIPVFSLILRPIMIIQNNIVYADINRKYALLLSYIDGLNKNDTAIDNKLIKVLPSLYDTQLVLNEIHNMIISMVGGKKGHIRSSLMGTRINYSSRCVITPLIGRYHTNELIIPYLCFLELYKFEIINLLSKIDGISINEANDKWLNATRKFDKRVYNIMKYMIKNTKGGLNAILNRK